HHFRYRSFDHFTDDVLAHVEAWRSDPFPEAHRPDLLTFRKVVSPSRLQLAELSLDHTADCLLSHGADRLPVREHIERTGPGRRFWRAVLHVPGTAICNFRLYQPLCGAD